MTIPWLYSRRGDLPEIGAGWRSSSSSSGSAEEELSSLEPRKPPEWLHSRMRICRLRSLGNNKTLPTISPEVTVYKWAGHGWENHIVERVRGGSSSRLGTLGGLDALASLKVRTGDSRMFGMAGCHVAKNGGGSWSSPGHKQGSEKYFCLGWALFKNKTVCKYA